MRGEERSNPERDKYFYNGNKKGSQADHFSWTKEKILIWNEDYPSIYSEACHALIYLYLVRLA